MMAANLNYNDEFLLVETEPRGGSYCLLGCLVSDDDLQKLHFVHRGEVVHSDNAVRTTTDGGNILDGQRRRI